MSLIDTSIPARWQELQEHAARILRESGVEAVVEETIELARGTVAVDVWAKDRTAIPEQTYLVECKLWKRRVSKEVVHSFRTIVGDSGANWGAIISSSGFQSGAREAARYSNIRLLTWDEFQELFLEPWYQRTFLPAVEEVTLALVEYTEPINSRVFTKADALPESKRARFRELREKYFDLGAFCTGLHAQAVGAFDMLSIAGSSLGSAFGVPDLPLRSALSRFDISADLLNAQSFRELLAVLERDVDEAVAEFDGVFGERA